MEDYEQPDAVTRRVRFFDGQFLQAQDFVDEQKYHLDRERRVGRVLRVTGVVDGLAVTSTEPNRITIAPGTAIDRDGRQLVLAEARRVDLPAVNFNDKQGTRVLIVYDELETELATTGSKSERRWLEDPLVVAVTVDGKSTATWDDRLPAVVLAQLRLDNKGTVTVDDAAAERAGMRLPGSLGIGGSLAVDGRLGIGTTDPQAPLDVRGAVRFGDGTGAARLVATATSFGLQDERGEAQLTFSQQTGYLGVGTADPQAPLDVSGWLRFGGSGKARLAADATMITLDDDGDAVRLAISRDTGNVGIGSMPSMVAKLYVRGEVLFGERNGTARLVATATSFSLQDTVRQDRLTISQDTGNVGLGKTDPRTRLDTGSGVMSGAPNDYMKAQFMLTGGGRVTWGGPDGRLKWTRSFVATAMERGVSFRDGEVTIAQPTSDIGKDNVHDGSARSATADGVVLRSKEALYAVHTVGGGDRDVSFRIRSTAGSFSAPSNWILVAVVNGDDRTVRLGTGVILGEKTSSLNGSPVPTGTIVMWSGSSDALPGGWALCDGSTKEGLVTPDLRARFVVGAGAGGGLTYKPDDKGDADQHSHKVPVAASALKTDTVGGHGHRLPVGWTTERYNYDVIGANRRHGIDPQGGTPGVRLDPSTDEVAGHSHAVTKADLTSESSTDNNRPRWYALCFIMKL